MRVFVTGASGWIGSAVVPELIGAGHQVVGLARSEAAAAALTAAGAELQRGTIDDLDILRGAAAAADGVIHLAFKHDIAFSGGFQEAADADRRAVETIGTALAGSNRPLVIASGLLGLVPGHMATEQDGREPAGAAQLPGGPGTRTATAQRTLDLATDGIRSCVVRLPPTVHGDGDHGFMAALVGIARNKGVSGYIGDGSNRWPAVHRRDAAHLFRLAFENAPAGSVVHAVGDEGVPMSAIAAVIGKQLAIPLRSIPAEDAGAHFGWLGAVVGIDSPASSTLTHELLGWQPIQPGLIEDLELGHYFRSPSA
ncbi:MAG TPA: SDR family oxidoreductase [Chloroflexia bacterium]|nr:SDR family oxidoreductase [Chloroflexia bacterium]